jgi:predicted acylesterase/phospholipase RssA
MADAWLPHAVSFSAGGVRSIGLVGALVHLRDQGILDHVDTWYGCSGGCIPAILGAIGASSAWIRDAICQLELQPIMGINGDLLAVYPQTWGVNDGALLITWLSRIIETWIPGFSNWTFDDMRREKSQSLVFIATNLTRGTQEVYSPTTTPTMRIMDGFRASIAIPLFFTPVVTASGDYVCDGVLLEYYPWNCVQDKANTLVVVNTMRGIVGRPIPATAITSMTDYIARVFELGFRYKQGDTPRYWIALNDTASFVDTKLSREERLELMRIGESAASSWVAYRTKYGRGVMPVTTGGTEACHPSCAALDTSSSDLPARDRMSDNHQSHSRPLPHDPSRGSHSGRKPAYRRWSM